MGNACSVDFACDNGCMNEDFNAYVRQCGTASDKRKLRKHMSEEDESNKEVKEDVISCDDDFWTPAQSRDEVVPYRPWHFERLTNPFKHSILSTKPYRVTDKRERTKGRSSLQSEEILSDNSSVGVRSISTRRDLGIYAPESPKKQSFCMEDQIVRRDAKKVGREYSLDEQTETLKKEIKELRKSKKEQENTDLHTLEEVIHIAERTQLVLEKTLQEKTTIAAQRAKADAKIEALCRVVQQKENQIEETNKLLISYESRLRASYSAAEGGRRD